MDKLKLIKDEAKKIFRESILDRKLQVSEIYTLEHKDTMLQYIERILVKLLRQAKMELDQQQLDKLKEEVFTDLAGFGLIEKLLKDPEITDILVNGPEEIYIEKRGKLEKVNLRFDSADEIHFMIERMMMGTGKRIDVLSPYVDFRVAGGARVTAVIPPATIDMPFFCIRKVLKDILTLEDLKRLGTVNQKLLDFLRYCVRARLNILISGSTGAGKTTLMNLLLKEFVPQEERVVIMEDTEEITVSEPRHFVRLLTRAANIEGKGEITLRDLVKLSLHLRPDRIVIGEVRGEETFHFLHAINTGHEGSMSTIHANNSEDALHRLEMLTLMDRPNIHFSVIRHFLNLGVDLIVHMLRLPSGQRVIAQASEFDYQPEGWVIKDIFSLQRGIRDNQEVCDIKLTGHVPSFIDKLKLRTEMPADFFSRTA